MKFVFSHPATLLVILFLCGFVIQAYAYPKVNDKDLLVEKVVGGLKYPTTMAFLGNNDFLILEKDNGTVRRVIDGHLLSKPLLEVNVSNGNSRGMFGIAVTTQNNKIYVFVSFLQTNRGKDFDDFGAKDVPSGNVVYRYELVHNSLVNPKLIRKLTATPGPFHYGGILLIGPDGNLYHVVGDTGPSGYKTGDETVAKNVMNGSAADGTSGIARLTINGTPPLNWILGPSYPLNTYYAYGIRNSFGMAFDPVTKNLWDTENGPDYGDELNLVEPGFNSGWSVVQGFSEVPQNECKAAVCPWNTTKIFPFSNKGVNNNNNTKIFPFDYLENFGGRGKYRDPKFVWNTKESLGITAVQFLNSSKLGMKYLDDMFVGDFQDGRIFHFKLGLDRTYVLLNGSLAGRVANSKDDLQQITFGSGFDGITDLKVGPDGYLYVISHLDGTVYRIIPAASSK